MGVCKIRFWETVMLVFKEDVFTHARSTSAILVGGDVAVSCGLCGSRYKSNWSVFKELPTSESDSEKLQESTEKETKKQVNESTRSGDTFSEFWTGWYLNNVQSESQVIELLSLKTKEKRQKFC